MSGMKGDNDINHIVLGTIPKEIGKTGETDKDLNCPDLSTFKIG